jgi:5'(3')-deoxyribonucleotidase
MYYKVYVVAKISDIDERMTDSYNRFNENFIFIARNKEILPFSTI